MFAFFRTHLRPLLKFPKEQADLGVTGPSLFPSNKKIASKGEQETQRLHTKAFRLSQLYGGPANCKLWKVHRNHSGDVFKCLELHLCASVRGRAAGRAVPPRAPCGGRLCSGSAQQRGERSGPAGAHTQMPKKEAELKPTPHGQAQFNSPVLESLRRAAGAWQGPGRQAAFRVAAAAGSAAGRGAAWHPARSLPRPGTALGAYVASQSWSGLVSSRLKAGRIRTSAPSGRCGQRQSPRTGCASHSAWQRRGKPRTRVHALPRQGRPKGGTVFEGSTAPPPYRPLSRRSPSPCVGLILMQVRPAILSYGWC